MRRLVSLAALIVIVVAGAAAQPGSYDIVIRGGHIVDGSGNPWFAGDVAIRNGRIAAVGRVPNAAAARTIEARGLVVSPGFIDLHTHSDIAVLADGTAQSKVRQGVTLDVMGESTSVAPRDGLKDEGANDGGVTAAGAVTPDWTTFTGYFQRVEREGVSINLISHVSSEQVRRVVMGYDARPATPAELDRMKKLVARSMEEGAWGLVTRFESGGPDHPAEVRERIKTDKDFIAWAKEHGWWEGIVMGRAGSEKNRRYEGMRVSEIAKQRGDADPADTCLTLMAEDGGRISGMFHTMSEDDVRLVMRQPWVAIASDGSAINLDAPGVPHPRNYSTNVRVLGYYVRDQRVLTLEDAVRRMTSLPAQILGLRDRGQLREGLAADVAVFDPAVVGETNSFEKPKSYAKGVQYVIVNGTIVIDRGEHTGAKPGRVVRSYASSAAKTH